MNPFKIVFASLLTLALMACASQPAPDSQSCVLGVAHGTEVLASAWGDPMDELITRASDDGHGWSCPPVKG
jgi:hypothetical protein